MAFDDNFQLTGDWFSQRCREFDALHFHWPEYLIRDVPAWTNRVPQIPGAWRVASFLGWRSNLKLLRRLLADCRRAGKRLIWTAHNLIPHGNRAQRFALAAYRAIAESTDLVICHDQAAADSVKERYSPPGEIVVMPHGNYDGTFPPPGSVQETRQRWCVSMDDALLVGVGTLRRYKGLEIVCQAIDGLKASPTIIVAGNPSDTSYVEELRRLASRNPRIRIEARSLSNQEFADLVTASDGVLLPYRSITGSGALLAALTLRRGVIASDLPLFRNTVAREPQAGRLFAPNDVAACRSALEDFLAIPRGQRAQAARRLADGFAWNKVIQPVVDVLNCWK